MNKITTIEEVKSFLHDGQSMMIGGFLHAGRPVALVEAVLGMGLKDLTILGNDTETADQGVGLLVVNRQVKKAIVTHIGTNPETGRQMFAGELEVTLVPQGTMVECMRAAGSGLGGVLTPTGLGTIVEEGKEKVTVDGKEYLLEKPIRADVALIKAHKADRLGNLVYHGSARNYNPVMAMAADLVIAEVDEIVEVGELDPESIITPGIFVDKVVLTKGGKSNG